MYSISVVIPLYNKVHYIKRALNSVYSQNIPVDEIIVVNDGSSDDGPDVIRREFPHVKLIDQTNQGVSVARNTGINHAKSDFVAFLDADDYWAPGFIKNIKSMMAISPQSGMFCTHYAFDTGGEVRPAKMKYVPSFPGILPDLFASCFNADLPITASSVCIQRSLLEEISGFPIGLKMGEDQVVWARIACLTKIMYHPDVAVYYDLSVLESACQINTVFEPAPQLLIYQQLLDDNAVPSHLITSLKKLMHLTVLSCVKNNLLANKKEQARFLVLNHAALIWDKYRFGALVFTYLPISCTHTIINFFRKIRF
jgi:glycosyltransferase involved in cell wall biosynthesis